MSTNLDSGQITALYTDVRANFDYDYNQMFKGPENWARAFVDPIDTDLDTVTLPWLHSRLGLRAGIRHQPISHRTILGDKAEVSVRKYEDGIEVSMHDLTSDRIGLWQGKIRELAEGAAFNLRYLLIDSFVFGETAAYTIYDGLPWFSNTHQKGGSTLDNLFTGVLNSTNFQAARTIMRRFPSDGGAAQPLNVVPNILAVAPDDEYTALELMNNSKKPDATFNTENILRGMATVIVIPEFQDTNDWYLFKTDAVVKTHAHVKKRDWSPFKINDISADQISIWRRTEKMAVEGMVYENAYPIRPELALKVVN